MKKPSNTIEILQFPKLKNEIEEFIINLFLDEVSESNWHPILNRPIKLADNDIDFHLDTAHGKMGIELVEDAPLNKLGYPGLKSEYTAGERSEHIIKLIEKKTRRYKDYAKTPFKALVIYITDDRLVLTPSIESLIIRYCLVNKMTFDYVFYLVPRSDLTCSLFLLYPQTEERRTRYLELDGAVLKEASYKLII